MTDDTVGGLEREIALALHTIIEKGARRVDGTGYYGHRRYSYRAYTIGHTVGPPTIRIDIKEVL